MTRAGIYGEAARIRFHWQDQIAGSGLHEVLALAKDFNDSGLFDEKELAPIRGELKSLALLLAKGLIDRLADESAEAEAAGPPRRKFEREFTQVRRKLKGVGKALQRLG